MLWNTHESTDILVNLRIFFAYLFPNFIIFLNYFFPLLLLLVENKYKVGLLKLKGLWQVFFFFFLEST